MKVGITLLAFGIIYVLAATLLPAKIIPQFVSNLLSDLWII